MDFERNFGTPEARYKLAQSIVIDFDFVLAAAAWRGFQKLGKGYIIVSPKYVDGNFVLGGIDYIVPDKDIVNFYQTSTISALPITQGLFEIVETYNPEETYVVMIDFSALLGKIEKDWFHQQPAKPPKLCYEIVKIKPELYNFKGDFD